MDISDKGINIYDSSQMNSLKKISNDKMTNIFNTYVQKNPVNYYFLDKKLKYLFIYPNNCDDI